MAKESRICLLDLEMSGLDPETERIIEVACFIVERDLTPVDGAEICLAVKPEDLGVLGSMAEQKLPKAVHQRSGHVHWRLVLSYRNVLARRGGYRRLPPWHRWCAGCSELHIRPP